MLEEKQPLLPGVSISLTALDGSEAGTRHAIQSLPAFLGQGPDADLQLAGSGVDPIHARLVWFGGGLYLEDLATGGVTQVNGSRQKRTKLSNGDIIEIGDHRLLLQLTVPLEAPPDAGAPAETAAPTPRREFWIAGFSEDLRDWFLTGLLPELGLDGQAFRTGEEVLVALSRALGEPRPPTVIILDLRLPIINGINAAIAIRAFELGFRSSERIPLVFLFDPVESLSFDKVVKFCSPVQVVSPGASEDEVKEQIRQLLGAGRSPSA